MCCFKFYSKLHPMIQIYPEWKLFTKQVTLTNYNGQKSICYAINSIPFTGYLIDLFPLDAPHLPMIHRITSNHNFKSLVLLVSSTLIKWLLLKVAEHSFRTRFCWCNSARAQGLQKTNMLSIERSLYLPNAHIICVTFLYNWTQCIDHLNLLLQRYVTKGNNAKNPAILSFFIVTKRTQLNAAHA